MSSGNLASGPYPLPQIAPRILGTTFMLIYSMAVAGGLQFCPKRMTKTKNLALRPAIPFGRTCITDVAIYFLPSLVKNMKHLFCPFWPVHSDSLQTCLRRDRKTIPLTEVWHGPRGRNNPVNPGQGFGPTPAFIPGCLPCPGGPGRRRPKPEPDFALGRSSGMELQMHLADLCIRPEDGAFRRLCEHQEER